MLSQLLFLNANVHQIISISNAITHFYVGDAPWKFCRAGRKHLGRLERQEPLWASQAGCTPRPTCPGRLNSGWSREARPGGGTTGWPPRGSMCGSAHSWHGPDLINNKIIRNSRLTFEGATDRSLRVWVLPSHWSGGFAAWRRGGGPVAYGSSSGLSAAGTGTAACSWCSARPGVFPCIDSDQCAENMLIFFNK